MSVVEIDRLLAYRKAGKYINSTREFQKVTGVSDSLLAIISPYFKFPDWVTNKNSYSKYDKKTKSYSQNNNFKKIDDFTGKKKDLNTVTADELIQIKGIGQKLAARILKYRSKLKGYLIDEQLYEVWYLDKEIADKVLQRFTVISRPKVKRININTAQFKEVLHAPYMNYKLTKKIFELRDEMAEIQSMEELKKIDSFPLDKFDRINLYLTAE
jgi:DNA uptake protein ComE-like DNA-binding protein